jgi:hypothetical protein
MVDWLTAGWARLLADRVGFGRVRIQVLKFCAGFAERKKGTCCWQTAGSGLLVRSTADLAAYLLSTSSGLRQP